MTCNDRYYELIESDILTEIDQILKLEGYPELSSLMFLEGMHKLSAYQQFTGIVRVSRGQALMIIDFIRPD